jgi:hypothetical protein
MRIALAVKEDFAHITIKGMRSHGGLAGAVRFARANPIPMTVFLRMAAVPAMQ